MYAKIFLPSFLHTLLLACALVFLTACGGSDDETTHFALNPAAGPVAIPDDDAAAPSDTSGASDGLQFIPFENGTDKAVVILPASDSETDVLTLIYAEGREDGQFGGRTSSGQAIFRFQRDGCSYSQPILLESGQGNVFTVGDTCP